MSRVDFGLLGVWVLRVQGFGVYRYRLQGCSGVVFRGGGRQTSGLLGGASSQPLR